MIKKQATNLAAIRKGDGIIAKVYKGDTLRYNSALPYDAEVEWIKTDGNAYINTGIKVAPTVTFHLEMYVTRPNMLVQLFGGRTSSSANKMYFFNDSRTSGGLGASWNYGDKAVTVALLSQSWHTFDNTTQARALIVNSTSWSVATPVTFSDTEEDFYIFALNRGENAPATGNIGNGVGVRKGKMYSSGTLVRDFIPVRKDGVGYLYDKVSGQLFGNAASSGAFTFGSDVTSNDTNSLNFNNGLLSSLNGNEPNDEPNEIDPIAMEDM